jgi:hypothetical protein
MISMLVLLVIAAPIGHLLLLVEHRHRATLVFKCACA